MEKNSGTLQMRKEEKTMTDNSKIAKEISDNTFPSDNGWTYKLANKIKATLDAKDAVHAKVEKALDDLLLIQKQSLDRPYMVGLYNGMLLAKSLFGHEYSPVYCPVDAKITHLNELIKLAIGALEFYAEEGNYHEGSPGEWVGTNKLDKEWEHDEGNVARLKLAKLRKEMGTL